MRFIHLADVHLGAVPDRGCPWSSRREEEIWETFRRVIAGIRENPVDLLFIAGDLFHRQPLLRELKEVNNLFSTIPDTRVYLMAGNHDYIKADSFYRDFQWEKNVTFFKNEQLTCVKDEKLDVYVYGLSYEHQEIEASLYDGAQPQEGDGLHILLAHGGDAKHVPMSIKTISASGFDYLALGHIHKPEILLENRMAYAGSPEPLDMTETGPHGYFIGEIDTTSGHVTSLQFKEVCQAQYIPLVVNVTPQTTNTELSQIIADEIRKRGANNIYRFRIRGMRDPDISFDLDFLSGQWNIIEILDESEPQYDFHALFAEHPSDMIGFYIQALMKDDMSPVEKKALYYGIHALLMTKDERSQP